MGGEAMLYRLAMAAASILTGVVVALAAQTSWPIG